MKLFPYFTSVPAIFAAVPFISVPRILKVTQMKVSVWEEPKPFVLLKFFFMVLLIQLFMVVMQNIKELHIMLKSDIISLCPNIQQLLVFVYLRVVFSPIR